MKIVIMSNARQASGKQVTNTRRQALLFATTAGKQVTNTRKLVATHYSEADMVHTVFGDNYIALLEIDPSIKYSTTILALQLGS